MIYDTHRKAEEFYELYKNDPKSRLISMNIHSNTPFPGYETHVSIWIFPNGYKVKREAFAKATVTLEDIKSASREENYTPRCRAYYQLLPLG